MTGSACRCGPVRRIRLSASGETSCVRTRQVDIVHVTNLRLSESVDPVPSDESHLMRLSLSTFSGVGVIEEFFSSLLADIASCQTFVG